MRARPRSIGGRPAWAKLRRVGVRGRAHLVPRAPVHAERRQAARPALVGEGVEELVGRRVVAEPRPTPTARWSTRTARRNRAAARGSAGGAATCPSPCGRRPRPAPRRVIVRPVCPRSWAAAWTTPRQRRPRLAERCEQRGHRSLGRRRRRSPRRRGLPAASSAESMATCRARSSPGRAAAHASRDGRPRRPCSTR